MNVKAAQTASPEASLVSFLLEASLQRRAVVSAGFSA
jgi:hypothetical protein